MFKLKLMSYTFYQYVLKGTKLISWQPCKQSHIVAEKIRQIDCG